MSETPTTPRTEAEWDDWQQDQKRYQRKEPLKRELLAARAVWQDTLNRVIRDGETITINGDDGQPAAVIMPYQQWLIRDLAKESNP